MKNNLSEQSLESLNKQKNLLKGAVIGYGIILLISFCLILYVAINKKNFALLAVFPASMIILLPLLIRFGQLDKEIKTRKN